MKDDSVKVRLAAVHEIGKLGTLAAAQLLVTRALPRERSALVVDAAISRIAWHASPAAVEWLVKASRKGPVPTRVMILEALARRADPDPAYPAFVAAAGDRDPRVRVGGILGLGAARRQEALPLLLEALEAREWQVRAAAIEGLGGLGDATAIRPLATRLGYEHGRLRGDIGEALFALTDQDLGYDAARWSAWLQAKETPEAASNRPPPADPPAAPTYYGLEVLSKRIVFVLDLSMSMKDAVQIDKQAFLRETRARGDTPGTMNWWQIKTGLDLARSQLLHAIGQLDKTQSFDIVTFSDRAESMQGRLLTAIPKIRALASKTIEQLDVIGRTNTHAALALAFELAAGRPGGSRSFATGPDTIYFLSDGAPSVGSVVEPEEILAEVRRWNRSRRIRIHVIGLNANVPFLRKLAAENGGEYKRF